MTKKWTSVLLAFVLLLSMIPAMNAEEQGEAAGAQAQQLFEPGQIQSMAVSDGTLYMAGDENLYAYDGETVAQVGTMPSDGQYQIFDGDGALWALETEEGLVGTIADGVFTQTLKLDYSAMQGSAGLLFIYGMCRSGDTLYLLALDEATYTGGQEQLLRFDLTTGEVQRDTLVYALSIAAYEDAAMVLRQDLTRLASGETGMALDSVNEDGALGETIISNTDYQTGAMVQAQDGDIYMSGGGQLKRASAGTISNIGGLGVGTNIQMTQARIVNGKYVVMCENGVLAAPLSGMNAGTTLTIIGGTMDDSAVRFMQDHPDISLNFDARQVTGSQGVRDDMDAGNGVDIYIVHELLGLRTLIDKGYVAEMPSETLKADVARMYLPIREALTRDGKLYAYPQRFMLNAWGVNRHAWNEVYGEDKPLPTTFDEFFDDIEQWEAEYAQDYPEYQFTQIYSGWQQLLSNVLEQYALMHATGEEALRFDDPVFVEALERLSGMELDSLDLSSLTEETMAALMAVMNKPAMIDVAFPVIGLSSYADQEEADKRELIAPMVFTQGETPAIRADLIAYVVNPASENIDAAMEYIEYMAAHQSGDMRAMLHEDENEPVRSEEYAKNVEELNETLEELESRLAEEKEEVARTDIQNEIDRIKAQLAAMEEREWLVSPEGLAQYRRLAPYMTLGSAVSFLYGGNDNMSATEEIAGLLDRFVEGQMGAQQLVKELDKKIQMIYLEGN